RSTRSAKSKSDIQKSVVLLTLSRAMPNRIIGLNVERDSEPAGSVDVTCGNTPSSTEPHAAPIARVPLAQAGYLVRAHRYDRVVDCRGRLFGVTQRRHPADG